MEFNGTSTIDQLKEYCHFIFLSDLNTVADLIVGRNQEPPSDTGKGKRKLGKKSDADGAKTAEASSLYDIMDTTKDSEPHQLANNARIARKLLHPVWLELLHGYSEVCSVLWYIQAWQSDTRPSTGNAIFAGTRTTNGSHFISQKSIIVGRS